MISLNYYRNQFFIATIFFIAFLVIAIITNNYAWLSVPFIFILFPVLFRYTISYTEQLFWMMIFFLPLSTEWNVTNSLSLDFPDEPLLILLTGFTILKFIYQPSLFPQSLLKSSLFFLVLLYLCWIIICCFFSINPILSVKFLLAKVWYIIPFVVLPQFLLDSIGKLKIFASCLLLPMLFVVVQALLRHIFFNFSFEGIKEVLDPFFRNHVNYSAMLVCLLAIGWCVLQLTKNNHLLHKWIFIGMIIGLIALILSYSRGAWLALITGIIVGALIHKKLLNKVILILGFIATIFVSFLLSNKNYLRFAPDFTHTIFHTDFTEHLQATVNLKDVSDAERFYRWVAGKNMIIAKPITGFGPNNFYDNYKPYTENIFKTWVSNNADHSSVHNYFLLTALEQGVVGVIIFLILLISLLVCSQKLYHQLQNEFYRAIALTTGVVVAMIGLVNMLSDLIETDKIGSLFWLSVGMILLLQQKLQLEKESIA